MCYWDLAPSVYQPLLPWGWKLRTTLDSLINSSLQEISSWYFLFFNGYSLLFHLQTMRNKIMWITCIWFGNLMLYKTSKFPFCTSNDNRGVWLLIFFITSSTANSATSTEPTAACSASSCSVRHKSSSSSRSTGYCATVNQLSTMATSSATGATTGK